MPNGDPDWYTEKLPELERFFGKFSEVLDGFAQEHHLRLEKYYHQAPAWAFLFRHPQGGAASIEVRRQAESDWLAIDRGWWYDDYATETRSLKTRAGTPFPVDIEVIRSRLQETLCEIVGWRLGDWEKSVKRGWQETWTSKEQFDALLNEYPLPSL